MKTKYKLETEYDTIELSAAATFADALKVAEKELQKNESGFWSGWVFSVDEKEIKHLTVVVNQPEPECTENDHKFECRHEIVGGLDENPGVFGHGGGVIIHEVCDHCGLTRITDTWAQNPETGEQGYETIEYDADQYREAWEVWKTDSLKSRSCWSGSYDDVTYRGPDRDTIEDAK